MDTELKTKWVEALRSGKYKQGRTFLRDPKTGAYCCLGVLCAVNGVDSDALFRCTTNVPFESGLTKEQRSYLGDVLNDNEGRSFAQIADYIEAEL